MNPYRMAGRGLLVGIVAFTCVILADPMGSDALFFVGRRADRRRRAASSPSRR